MAVYAQHGHGKSDKIVTGLSDGSIEGVIFAPRNEKPDNLRTCLETLSEDHGCELLVDPQLYVATFTPANMRYLEEYDFFEGGLSASDFSLRRIRQIARDTIDYQAGLPVTAILSPTVMFGTFSDRWYQIALNLADAAREHHGSLPSPPPLLLSFVFAEEALTDEDEIGRFLDTVTQDDWSMEGFYLVAARHEPVYSQDFDPVRLANYLYLVHALGTVNGLRVVVGYTDFVGIPLRAAGAAAFATGWSQGLRQFVRKNFLQKKPGGQPPRDRYSSAPLLNSILMQEMQEIFDVGRLRSVLSDVALDSIITSARSPQGSPWNQAISQQHHWQTLHAIDQSLTGRVRRDTLETLRRVREAQGLYTILERNGIEFERSTGKDHLASWSRALSDFARRAGIDVR
ncbi:MAG: hypothetical protein K8T91_11005 [Planctomycetes bacterium]|nr:hypothetical protein [Planctomycetota bacterium]